MKVSMKLTNRNIVLIVRRFIRSSHAGDFRHGDVSNNFDRARKVVRFYYVCSVYLCANLLDRNDKDLQQVTDWDLLWPLLWVDVANIDVQMKLIGAAAFVFSLMAVLFTGSMVVRLLFSGFFLLSATLTNSYAGINHPYHAWFWISFVFVFLPSHAHAVSDHNVRTRKMSYLTVLVAAQAMLLYFYTLSGTWKIIHGIGAINEGLDGIFSLGGLSHNLANRVLQTNSTPLLAEFAIENFAVSWLGVMAVLYIQFTAVIAAFRPRLHLWWGLTIVMFHFGTWLLMGIVFSAHVLLLLLLFVISPFRPAVFDPGKTVLDLPVIGPLAGMVVMKVSAKTGKAL